MKIESPSYTENDFHAVIGGYLERDRAELIERLRGIVTDAEALLPSLDGPARSEGDSWSAVETLAHIAVSAQFFGWVIHEVSQGHEIGGRMLELMKLRDPIIVDSVDQTPEALVEQLRRSVDRTIAFLKDVPYERLRTTITFAGRSLSAEDFLRVSLVHHLEDHLEQARAAILPA